MKTNKYKKKGVFSVECVLGIPRAPSQLQNELFQTLFTSPISELIRAVIVFCFVTAVAYKSIFSAGTESIAE
jgi:hypothetical protein